MSRWWADTSPELRAWMFLGGVVAVTVVVVIATDVLDGWRERRAAARFARERRDGFTAARQRRLRNQQARMQRNRRQAS